MIAIADTGVGMDAEALAQLFEPYFSTKATGTGLGLTIAKRNVELNGGTIAVTSEKGRGNDGDDYPAGRVAPASPASRGLQPRDARISPMKRATPGSRTQITTSTHCGCVAIGDEQRGEETARGTAARACRSIVLKLRKRTVLTISSAGTITTSTSAGSAAR